MRPLRYSINVTLDGCCDHRAGVTDEELHRYWAENLAQADALLFGRVTYEMMEEVWRLSTRTVVSPENWSTGHVRISPGSGMRRCADRSKRFTARSCRFRILLSASEAVPRPHCLTTADF